jgi:hypothetical protein
MGLQTNLQSRHPEMVLPSRIELHSEDQCGASFLRKSFADRSNLSGTAQFPPAG